MIYLTNAATVNAHRRAIDAGKPGSPCVGPGRVLTIMRRPRPRYGEAGIGSIDALTPSAEVFDGLRDGEIDAGQYRAAVTADIRARGDGLRPGALIVMLAPGGSGPVRDGDTLICACSRAQAADGWCHRVWAAHALADHGWHVVLDGVRLVAPSGTGEGGSCP